MNYKTLIENLIYGELSGLNIADTLIEDMPEKDSKRLLSITNMALGDLYNRFVLSEKGLLVESIDWKSTYDLVSSNAKYGGNNPNGFILDFPTNPFKDDLIKILSVTNEVGDELPLNDAEQWASVFTPQYNVLVLTHVGDSQVFEVTYQAKHEALEWNQDTNIMLAQNVNVPPALEEALVLRVASRYFNGMSGQESSTKSQDLLMRYEQLCNQVTIDNMLNDSTLSTNVKLMNRFYY